MPRPIVLSGEKNRKSKSLEKASASNRAGRPAIPARSGSLLSCATGAGEDFFWAGADWATAAIELAARTLRKNAKRSTLNQGCRIFRTTASFIEFSPTLVVYLHTNERQSRLTGIGLKAGTAVPHSIAKISRFNYKFWPPRIHFRNFQSKATELCICLPSSRLALSERREPPRLPPAACEAVKEHSRCKGSSSWETEWRELHAWSKS